MAVRICDEIAGPKSQEEDRSSGQIPLASPHALDPTPQPLTRGYLLPGVMERNSMALRNRMENHPLVKAKQTHAAHIIQHAMRKMTGNGHQNRLKHNIVLGCNAFVERAFAPDVHGHGSAEPFSSQRSRKQSLERHFSYLARRKNSGQATTELDLSDAGLAGAGATMISRQMIDVHGALGHLTCLNLAHNNIGALGVDADLLKRTGWTYRRHSAFNTINGLSSVQARVVGTATDGPQGVVVDEGGAPIRHGQRVYCKAGHVRTRPPREAVQAGGLIDLSRALGMRHSMVTDLDLSFNKLASRSLRNSKYGAECGWGQDPRHYKMDTHGVTVLAAALAQNKMLTRLDISHNDIQDGVGLIVAALETNRTLAVLNVRNNSITLKQARQLITTMETHETLGSLTGIREHQRTVDFSGQVLHWTCATRYVQG
jgi:hypothetical protein